MIDFEDSIYVAGHKGLAGSAICRALLRKGYKNLITVSKEQLNLKDQKEVKDWFEYKINTKLLPDKLNVRGKNRLDLYKLALPIC